MATSMCWCPETRSWGSGSLRCRRRPRSCQRSSVPRARVSSMTVFHALLWIATSGGTERFAPDDGDRWQKAFDMLLPELASGHVALTGERLGERAVIHPYVLAACRFAPPFGAMPAGLLHATDLYLRSYPYIDEEHWRAASTTPWWWACRSAGRGSWSRRTLSSQAWPFGSDMPTMTVRREGQHRCISYVPSSSGVETEAFWHRPWRRRLPRCASGSSRPTRNPRRQPRRPSRTGSDRSSKPPSRPEIIVCTAILGRFFGHSHKAISFPATYRNSRFVRRDENAVQR